jgi:hypothetical protein
MLLPYYLKFLSSYKEFGDGHKTKKALSFRTGLIIKDRQRLTLPGFILVPSALVGLTSLFGMGRGDPHRYSHLKTCPDVSGA